MSSTRRCKASRAKFKRSSTVRKRFWSLIHTTNFELSRWRSSGNNHAANGEQCRRCETFVITPVFTDFQVSNTITVSQLREGLRKWQSPSDPSTNHNFASDRQHEGTAEWFCRGRKFEEWKVAGSLLWIHGKRMLFFFLLTSMI